MARCWSSLARDSCFGAVSEYADGELETSDGMRRFGGASSWWVVWRNKASDETPASLGQVCATAGNATLGRIPTSASAARIAMICGRKNNKSTIVPLTKIETELRQEARGRIARGDLPCTAPKKVYAGKGNDELCSLCARLIHAELIEYEVVVAERTLHFHLLCHGIWQIECARFLELTRRSAFAGGDTE